jgi:Zn-dependent protease with chaperone function
MNNWKKAVSAYGKANSAYKNGKKMKKGYDNCMLASNILTDICHNFLSSLKFQFMSGEKQNKKLTRKINELLGYIIDDICAEHNIPTIGLWVVNSPTVNAYASPCGNGNIVFYTGLFDLMNCSNLDGDLSPIIYVLCHEIGHLVHRHSAKLLVDHLRTMAIMSGLNSIGVTKFLEKQFLDDRVALNKVIYSSFGQGCEMQADDFSFHVIGCYEILYEDSIIKGLAYLCEHSDSIKSKKVVDEKNQTNQTNQNNVAIKDLLATHPEPHHRLNRITERIENYNQEQSKFIKSKMKVNKDDGKIGETREMLRKMKKVRQS